MKVFTDDAIAALNRQMGAGLFFKAAILSDPVAGNVYLVDLQRSMEFGGNTYQVQPMTWSGQQLGAEMRLPTIQLVMPDPDGTTEDYLESINMVGRDATLQLMHLDITGLRLVEEVHLQIMAVGTGQARDADLGVVTFTLGLNLGLNDMLPRDVITLAEFPSVPTRLRRASIL